MPTATSLDRPRPVDLPDTDSDLLTRTRNGESAAFEALWKSYFPRLSRFATRLYRNDGEALAMEAFARTFALLRRGEGPHEFFYAYVCTIVRRLAMVGWERSASESSLADESEDGRHYEHSREDVVAARRAIESISAAYREVLWLSEIEGYTEAEIAVRIGSTRGGVAMMKARAKESLRQSWIAANMTTVGRRKVCVQVQRQLPALVRSALASNSVNRILDHLHDCVSCAESYADAMNVNRAFPPISRSA